jgi:superfamily II DNA/RNA helicase
LPKKRQTLLFSATISPEVKTLAGDMLKSPKVIQIGRPRNPIDTITQQALEEHLAYLADDARPTWNEGDFSGEKFAR